MRSLRSSKDEERVYPVIAGMAIGNPQYRCTQDEALAVASKCPGIETVRPVLERIYGNSRIGSRYFAVPDFTPGRAAKGDPMFFPADGSFEVKTILQFQCYYLLCPYGCWIVGGQSCVVCWRFSEVLIKANEVGRM